MQALSIQQKFRFEISEMSRAQWNDTFSFHRPDPSHRAFGYCSCKQETGYKRAILGTDRSKWTTFKKVIFQSDQTEVVRFICPNSDQHRFSPNNIHVKRNGYEN